MNKYTKPTFMIASLGVTALAGSNCSIQREDREMISSVLDRFGVDMNAAFIEAENCTEIVDEFVDGYCKFTAGSNGATQIFFS